MAVSRTERAQYEDQLARTREEAETRETETSRRKNEELKNAERRHSEEIRRLNQEFQQKVSEIQSRNREILTDRDVDHQKDVEDLKHMYIERLRKKSEQGQVERKTLSETYTSTLEKQKQIDEQQKQNIMSKHEDDIKLRDTRISDMAEKNRQTMSETISDNSRKMKESHEKERQVLIKSREDLATQKRLEFEELRKAHVGELNMEKRKRDFSEKSWEQKYYDTVKGNTEDNVQNQTIAKERLKAEGEYLRQDYHRKLAEKIHEVDEANELFKDQVSDRVNDQLRSRTSQINQLKQQSTRDRVNNDRLKALEIKNLTQQYEARMDDLERQRSDYVEKMSDLLHTRVGKARQDDEHALREASKNYRSQMNLVTTQNREERKLMNEQQEGRLSHVKNTADQRISKLQRLAAHDNQELAKRYDESVQELKDGFSVKVSDQRDKNQTERMQLNQIMTKRVQNMGDTYQSRLENIQSEFEAKLGQMRDEHRREIRRIENNYKNFATDREKGYKVEKESIQQKYESKIAAIEEQHLQDKELQQKRHEEDMRNLSNRLSNYSRKA